MTEIAKNQCYYPHCACEHEMCEFATQAELNRTEKHDREQMAEAFCYATPHWNDGKGNASQKAAPAADDAQDRIKKLTTALLFYCTPAAYAQTNVPMDDVRHPCQIAMKAIQDLNDAQKISASTIVEADEIASTFSTPIVKPF